MTHSPSESAQGIAQQSPQPGAYPEQLQQTQPNIQEPNVYPQQAAPKNEVIIKPSPLALISLWAHRAYSIGCSVLVILIILAMLGIVLYFLDIGFWIIKPSTILIISIIIFIIGAVIIFWGWTQSFYKIEPGLITIQRGFTQKRETILYFVKMGIVQNAFQKMIGVGDIYISFQAAKDEVHLGVKALDAEPGIKGNYDIAALNYVPKPERYTDDIQRILSQSQPAQGE